MSRGGGGGEAEEVDWMGRGIQRRHFFPWVLSPEFLYVIRGAYWERG